MLKALGASVCVKNFRIQHSRNRLIFEWVSTFNPDYLASDSTFPIRPLEIGLFYYMPTLFYRRLSGWDESRKRAYLLKKVLLEA